MSNKNNKQLTSSILLEAYSKEFTQKKVTININNEDYDVLVDLKFKNTKIDEFIKDWLNNFDNYKELDKSIGILYFSFLTIKHFTSLNIIETNTFEEQIRLLNILIDLDVYSKLINEFPESELEKINDYMFKFFDKMNNFIKDDKNNEILKKMIDDGLLDVDGELVDKVGESEIDEVVNKIEITDTE